MRWYKTILSTVVVLYFFPFNSLAQNSSFWEDVKSISGNMEKYKYFKSDITFKAYVSSLDSTLVDTKKASVLKENKNIDFIIEEQESFFCKEYSIFIDHTEKSIIILQPEKQYFKKLTGLRIDQLDTLILQSFMKESDSIKVYDIYIKPYSDVSRIVFYVNKRLKLVNRITTYYSTNRTENIGEGDSIVEYKKPVLDILFSNIITDKKLMTTKLSYKNYFIRKKKDLILTSKYSDYTIESKLYFNK